MSSQQLQGGNSWRKKGTEAMQPTKRKKSHRTRARGGVFPLLSHSFPSDTLVGVCSFLSVSDLTRLDTAATNHAQHGRQYLHEAFALLPFELDVEVCDMNSRAQFLVSFAASRFRNTCSVTLPFPVRNFSVCQASQFSNLKELRLKNIFVDTCDFTLISEACTELHTLYIKSPYMDNCEDGREIIREIQHMSSLTSLTLACCDYLNDSCLQIIATGCRSLRSLDVGGSMNISDIGIGEFCKECPNLTQLNIPECPKITHTGIILVSDSLENLQYLNLSGNPQFQWSSICHLMSRNNSLIGMDLSHCNNVDFSNFSFESLKFQMNLASIDISFNPTVNDTFVHSLGKYCPNLKYLLIKSCPLVTDRALESFEYHFQSLFKLHIGGTNRSTSLTDVALRNLDSKRGGRFVSMEKCSFDDVYDLEPDNNIYHRLHRWRKKRKQDKKLLKKRNNIELCNRNSKHGTEVGGVSRNNPTANKVCHEAVDCIVGKNVGFDYQHHSGNADSTWGGGWFPEGDTDSSKGKGRRRSRNVIVRNKKNKSCEDKLNQKGTLTLNDKKFVRRKKNCIVHNK